MLIRAANPELDYYESTNLEVDLAQGATSATVENNANFVNGDRILLGEMGHDSSEIGHVNAAVTAGTTLPIAATLFPHSADEPVYKLRFDEVKIYRSTTGQTGAYSLLATVPIDVSNENLETTYDDLAGTANYWYTISYHNSATGLESDQSDPVLGSGYGRTTVGHLFDEVLHEVKDENELITDRAEMLGWLNEVNDDLITRNDKPYPWLRETVTINTVAGQEYVELPADYWKFDELFYSYSVGGNTSRNQYWPLDYNEFMGRTSNRNALHSDNLQEITIDEINGRILLQPTPLTTQTGVITLTYYRQFKEIDSEGDTLETPNPMVYKKFLMGQFYLRKSASESTFLSLSDRYMGEYNAQVAKLQRVYNKKPATPRGFKPLPARRRRYA